ncbi:hypothetical protein ACWKWK_12230 [Pseudoxanthomonas beigongshangi]
MNRQLTIGLGALFSLIAGAAVSPPAQGGDGLGAEWTPIDPARLDTMRGGFQLPSGAMLSFGIERMVFINGELAASTSVRVADLSRLTAEEARALGEFNRGIVVQRGDGNRFEPVRLPGGVVIQNTLDNQNITTITRLQVDSHVLGGFQGLNAGGALQDALIGSAGTR